MSSSDIEVLVIVRVADEALNQIAAVDSRIHVVDGRGWFDVEYRESWPSWSVQRYLGARSIPLSSRQERDRMLTSAEVILGGWPFPLDLRARSTRLRWFHQLPAGASNLLRGDLWGSDVMVTTSRGHGNIRPMAEYVLASFLHFARGFHRAYHTADSIASTIAPIDLCFCRARRCVSSVPVVSARRSLSSAPV